MIVVDASVALKWVLDEPDSLAAEALLHDELTAPELWLCEAANALWRRARQGDLTPKQAGARLAELFNAPVASTEIAKDLGLALEWADRLDHPVYDCLYLAAAIREQTHLVTADRRFHAAAIRSDGARERVRLLGA